MRALLAGGIGFALLTTIAQAQQLSATAKDTPRKVSPEVPALSLPLEVKADQHMMHFDPNAVEVRRNGQRWQVWSGRVLLKDFAEHREHAFEARRLIAEMKLSD